MILLMHVWEYLWNTYKKDGGVPAHISDAISLIQERFDREQHVVECERRFATISEAVHGFVIPAASRSKEEAER
jgi:hypothetical protein